MRSRNSVPMLPAQLSHVMAQLALDPHCSEPTLHWAGTATTPGHGARENQSGVERGPGAPSQCPQPSCDNHTGDITQTQWHHSTTPTGRSDNRLLQGCGQARGRPGCSPGSNQVPVSGRTHTSPPRLVCALPAEPAAIPLTPGT